MFPPCEKETWKKNVQTESLEEDKKTKTNILRLMMKKLTPFLLKRKGEGGFNVLF